MPIDLDRALGATLPSDSFQWDPDRVILYHLGVGAGSDPTDPAELRYVYEGDLQVLPSFGTIPPFGAMMNVGTVPGLEFNVAMLLHGEQSLVLHRPIPTAASAINEGRITAIHDKGKAAVVVVEIETRDAQTGEALFTNTSSLFLRGEGGFGGDPGPPTVARRPDRVADVVVETATLPQQALLYRLSGDKNPLHADPTFAAMGGFDRPILHGLCSYGVVCKAVVDEVLKGDVEAVRSYSARFAGVVFPGETVVTSVWEEDGDLVVEATTKERGAPVLSHGSIERTRS